MKPTARVTDAARRYSRAVHYEVLDGVGIVMVGKKRDGKPRNSLAMVVYHFTDERDARAFARIHRRTVFRVEGQRRTELRLRLQ